MPPNASSGAVPNSRVASGPSSPRKYDRGTAFELPDLGKQGHRDLRAGLERDRIERSPHPAGHGVAIGDRQLHAAAGGSLPPSSVTVKRRPAADFEVARKSAADVDNASEQSLGRAATAAATRQPRSRQQDRSERGRSWLLRVGARADELAAAGTARAVLAAPPPRSDRRRPRWRSWPARPARRQIRPAAPRACRCAGRAANSPTSSISHMNVPSMPRATILLEVHLANQLLEIGQVHRPRLRRRDRPACDRPSRSLDRLQQFGCRRDSRDRASSSSSSAALALSGSLGLARASRPGPAATSVLGIQARPPRSYSFGRVGRIALRRPAPRPASGAVPRRTTSMCNAFERPPRRGRPDRRLAAANCASFLRTGKVVGDRPAASCAKHLGKFFVVARLQIDRGQRLEPLGAARIALGPQLVQLGGGGVIFGLQLQAGQQGQQILLRIVAIQRAFEPRQGLARSRPPAGAAGPGRSGPAPFAVRSASAASAERRASA